MESEIMDLKTEMIKNRKAMEEFRSISDSNSFNNKVAEFRQEVDMLFKSAKNDFAGNEFNNRLLELQKELDDLRNSNNDNKYTKDSKKVKVKQMENLEQVTVEVQRLSDGLNNLFNFTQAQIDSQAYEKERLIHSDSNVKDKIECMEFVAKNLEFISDEAINSVVSSFEEVAVSSVYGSQQKYNVAEYKYTGAITSNIMDMIVV